MISIHSRALLFLPLCFVLLPSTAPAAPQKINQPNTNDLMAAQIYRLDNGLTVYLTENHETPRVAIRIAVRAGSKQDPRETTGLAHYLEHLLFKGTTQLGTLDYAQEKPHIDRIIDLYEDHFQETDPAKRTAIYAEINKETQLAAQFEVPNEMDKLYSAMGAQAFNAHTSDEQTVFEINLPSNHLEQWAAIDSERFLHPVFRLFQPELEIVYEEKNQSLDNKDRPLWEAVNRLLYKNHPYGQQTTLGEVEHLKNPSLKNVTAFYQRNYVPSNMAVAISGDIDPAATLHVVDQYFSAWPARPAPPQQTWAEQPLQGVERVTVKYKAEDFALLAFRLPGRSDPDFDALQLVDMVLDNSTAGLINLNLNEQQKVRQAGSYPVINNDFGGEYLWAIPKSGQSLREVEDLLVEQLTALKKGEFDEAMLSAIVTEFKKGEKSTLESNDSRATKMINAFTSFQDWDHVVGDLGRIGKLTKADVVRVANKYFGGGYVAGYRVDGQQVIPKIEKPVIDKINIDPKRQSAFAKKILAMPVKPLEPVWIQPGQDYKKSEVESGAPLYYVKNPLNDLFALNITIDIGSRHDMRLVEANQLLNRSGTQRLNPEALKTEWYKLGTDFGMEVGENETHITLSGLDENLARSWSLLCEVLTKPNADTATLDELKAIIKAQRDDSKKDPQTIADAVREYNRYGTNSAYLRELPTDRLSALTTSELLGLVKSLPGYHRTIAYTGSLPIEKVQEILRQHPASMTPAQPPPAYRNFVTAAPARDQIRLFDKEMAQSQMFIEFADGLFDEKNTPVVHLINDYFSGGMSGVVFQELREARALAYEAYANYTRGVRPIEQNVVSGYISCQADKTQDALTGFLELFQNMPRSSDRFAATRDSVISRYRSSKLEFRQIADTIQAWEKLNLPIDPRPARFTAVEKLTLDDLVNFQQQHYKDRPRLISIVGDSKKFNLDSLKATSDLSVVSLDQLFAY